METSLPKKEQIKLINTFDNLPPNEVLPVFPSAKELDKYLGHKGFWLSLKQAFSNYFSGKHFLEEIIIESPVGYELLNVKFNKYLALYNMLNLGWDDIVKAFKSTILPGNTPGELFTYILESESRFQFEDNKEPLDAQILYRGWRLYNKCLDPTIETRQQEVGKLEKLIARLKRQRKKLGGEENLSEYILLSHLCLETCLKSKNVRVRNKAKGFEQSRYDHIDMICRQLRRQDFDLNKNQPIPTIYISPEEFTLLNSFVHKISYGISCSDKY
jgi:hypothetical protein